MGLLRVFAVLFALAIVACTVLYLITGNPRFARLARRLVIGAAIAAVVFFGLLLLAELLH